MMDRLRAIKIVRETTNLDVHNASDLVERIAPLVQMSREEIQKRLMSITYSIDFIMAGKNEITLARAEELLALVKEREGLRGYVSA